MQKQELKTHVVLVLDKSSSMCSIRDATITGFNEQVDQMRVNAKDQQIKVSLITFNGSVFEHFWGVDVENLQKISKEDYYTNGSTAMYDALGHALEKLLKEDDNETSYLATVISDGESNSDVKYGSNCRPLPNFKTLRKACDETGRFTITYMGCSEASLDKVAKDAGIIRSNMAVFKSANVDEAKASYAANNVCTQGYFSARSRGMARVSNFYDPNESQVGDVVDSSTSMPIDQNGIVLGDTPSGTPVDQNVVPRTITGSDGQIVHMAYDWNQSTAEKYKLDNGKEWKAK